MNTATEEEFVPVWPAEEPAEEAAVEDGVEYWASEEERLQFELDEMEEAFVKEQVAGWAYQDEICDLEKEVERLKAIIAGSAPAAPAPPAAKAPKPAKAAAVITSVKLVQDPDWVGIKPPTKALGGDLAKILVEGEEVRVCFGARKEKKEYIGIYSAGGINGHGSPSLFAKVSAWTHYGTTDHKTEYNGWVKCEVQRGGAWVTLKSLRD